MYIIFFLVILSHYANFVRKTGGYRNDEKKKQIWDSLIALFVLDIGI